ncbi:hypothetical protein ACOSP7_009604 [Xanthoceras sorbifolium]
MSDFLVIDCPTAYNAVLKRPALNDLEVITSTKYLTLKLPTLTGVKSVHGEQKVAKSCYENIVRIGTWEKVAKVKANEQRMNALVRVSHDQPIPELDDDSDPGMINKNKTTRPVEELEKVLMLWKRTLAI